MTKTKKLKKALKDFKSTLTQKSEILESFKALHKLLREFCEVVDKLEKKD